MDSAELLNRRGVEGGGFSLVPPESRDKAMLTAHKILTGIIITLGVLHVSVTFHDYDSFSVGALWFAGAGVAIILAGFLNIILLRDGGKDRVVRALCLVTNLTFAVMFVLALLVLPQPQVFVGAGLFIGATLLSLAKSPG